MPVFHEILGRLNDRFRRGNIEAWDPNDFAGDDRLASIASAHGIVGNSDSVSYMILDSIPEGMQHALKGMIHFNLQREPQDRWEMTFGWAPGYDNEVTIWEAPSTVVSRAGFTILLRTRYPADPHPSGLGLAGATDSSF